MNKQRVIFVWLFGIVLLLQVNFSIAMLRSGVFSARFGQLPALVRSHQRTLAAQPTDYESEESGPPGYRCMRPDLLNKDGWECVAKDQKKDTKSGLVSYYTKKDTKDEVLRREVKKIWKMHEELLAEQRERENNPYL